MRRSQTYAVCRYDTNYSVSLMLGRESCISCKEMLLNYCFNRKSVLSIYFVPGDMYCIDWDLNAMRCASPQCIAFFVETKA